jgi:hypothetical protein
MDQNAASWGWFVDSTPRSDAEFTTPANQGEQHRLDLLTVVMHEMGHVLGKEHEDTGVMIDILPAGTRRTPGSAVSLSDWSGVDWFLVFVDLESTPLHKRLLAAFRSRVTAGEALRRFFCSVVVDGCARGYTTADE